MDKNKLKKIEEASVEAEKAKQVAEEMNILDILLDEDNKEPIVLVDGKGKRISFEQIAVIPYKERIYAVLKPVENIEGIADDEAIVFYVDATGEEPVLMVETDEKTAIAVFDEYYNLLDESETK